MPGTEHTAGGEETGDAPDFTNYTCTRLMIRLKLLLKDAGPETIVTCIVRRDQCDTIEVPFSRSGYTVSIRTIGENRFFVALQKEEGGGL